MSTESSKYLKQCMELTMTVWNKDMMAYINIKVGDEFTFTFSNQEKTNIVELPKIKNSPSQLRRNQARKEKFRTKTSDETVTDTKIAKAEVNVKETKNVSENTENDEVQSEKDVTLPVEEGKESKDLATVWMDCWDPDDKWTARDVNKHLKDTFATMFKVFKVDDKDREYDLDIGEKSNEMFPVKLKIKQSKDFMTIINNFRRDGYVEGGGCVNFIRIRREEFFY